MSLLLLLFTLEEIQKGNCTKPVRGDIVQLDMNRLWAIKCKKYVTHLYSCGFVCKIAVGYVDYKFPLDSELEGKEGGKEVEKMQGDRWLRPLPPIINNLKGRKLCTKY